METFDPSLKKKKYMDVPRDITSRADVQLKVQIYVLASGPLLSEFYFYE